MTSSTDGRRNGIFITFEGIDGCGKTTQIARVRQLLEERGADCLSLREPGGTAIGEAIRAILLDPAHTAMTARSELLLFAAARAQLVDQVIRPALQQGKLVLCDRFTDSTLAYQGGGRDRSLDEISQINTVATGGLCPHRTFLLTLPVDIAANRVKMARGSEADRLDQESLGFMEKVQQTYLAVAKADPDRFTLLDATRPPEELAKVIASEILAIRG